MYHSTHVQYSCSSRSHYIILATQGCVKRLMQHEVKPSVVFVSRHSSVIALPGCLVQSDFLEYPSHF